MQPNTPQSGNNQDPAVGQVPFNAPQNQELPEVDPTNLGMAPSLPSPTDPSATGNNTQISDDWAQRIQHVMMTEPNPRQRAASFAQLKSEYQQNVLGISNKPAEGQKP